jgi:MCM P-loop domain/Toprim-like
VPRVANRHINALKPFLVGESARSNGEWDMYCPLHPDSKRSASLNVLTGQFYCFACAQNGLTALDLIRSRSRWVNPDPAARNGAYRPSSNNEEPPENINLGMIEGWHSALMSDESALDDLITSRGIYTKTIAEYRIGYDYGKRVYTIPVFGPEGEIWNVRRYNLYAPPGRRKIWSVRDMRPTELYPINQLEYDTVVICEGEWDALVTIQHGYPAVTRTASAQTWQWKWNEYFKDKTVYLAHDCDDTGDVANRKVARALKKVAADVRIVKLPFEHQPKHGEDLSDFWQQFDRADFERLLKEAESINKKHEPGEEEIITVLDSFDAQKIGKPSRLQVTIKGKQEPGYSIPKIAQLTCDMAKGIICEVCPMKKANGNARYEIDPGNPAVLSMLDAPKPVMLDAVRESFGVPVKCSRLDIEVDGHQAVEILFARPSIDHADGTKAKDYKNIKITSVGRHDTISNSTVVVTGARHPSPKDQRNEFLAWDVKRQETSVDHFEMTPVTMKLLKRFQPRRGQRPIKKLSEINRELAAQVTRIVGRPEMHAVIDLTFHSILSWKFADQMIHRGWLEALIVGDTRTGKSEAVTALIRHYGAGEIVGGEAATVAGLVGGVQQVGGKDWTITWGVIPINDRRFVAIDELSGLHPEDIAKMSDVRASGMARITKITQEVTFARTRLLWLGNPRHGGMDQFTHGVDAIKPLIGNPEDIARFDLAMAVGRGDVAPSEYNKRIETKEPKYTSEACHTLLMWAWTRQPEHVVWAKGAEDQIYKLALEMDKKYTEEPPLMQAANARIKIARVAIALAARTFSTDDGERVIVTKDHVEDAVTFLDLLYSMPAFGYAERSKERLDDLAEAEENREDIRTYLLERRGLAKLLRSNSAFVRQDLEEVLNVDRDAANAIINKLWGTRMIRKDGKFNRVEPTLHALLREVRW